MVFGSQRQFVNSEYRAESQTVQGFYAFGTLWFVLINTVQFVYIKKFNES